MAESLHVCAACEKALRVSILSTAVFLLAVGAVALWAFSATIELHRQIEDARIERRTELIRLEQKMTNLYFKNCGANDAR